MVGKFTTLYWTSLTPATKIRGEEIEIQAGVYLEVEASKDTATPNIRF